MDIILRQILAIALVFGLLGLVVWRARRGGAAMFPFRRRSGPARALESLERLALTPQHVLHVVRVRGREIVVATYPGGLSVVKEGDA